MLDGRTGPSQAWLPVGSITLLLIITAIILVTGVFALSRNWTIGLSIGLVMLGLVVALVTISGWRDWRLFRDTAVETPGEVVQRIHEQHEGDYGGTTHEYFLVVRFMNGKTPIRLKERVDETTYAKTREGSSLVVRYAPSKPRLARFQWVPDT